MYSLDFRIVIIKKGEIVEAMPSKVILMMPKNQKLSKFQRFKNLVSRIKIQDSTIKFQESSFKNNRDQDSKKRKGSSS